MTMTKCLTLGLLASTLLTAAAYAEEAQKAPANPEPKPLPAAAATAQLLDAGKRDAGTVEIFEGKEGLVVRVEAKGLPEGWHGFHFHQVGSCDDEGFKKAGGHMDGGHPHGVLSEGPHGGDLPNIYAHKDGTVKADAFALHTSLKGEGGLLDKDGTAVMIHAGADDYQSQPSGASGDRIACGVVKPADGKS